MSFNTRYKGSSKGTKTLPCCPSECLNNMQFFGVWIHSQSKWLSTCASAGFEKHCHRSLVWRLNIGLLLRLDLFICHPTMHWETREGRGGWVGLFKRTTAGIFQPNGHVFTLGYFLISHCNENDKKDSFLQRSLYSRESDTITQQISQILSFILVNVCSSECWLATYCSLLPLLSFIGFTTLLLDTSL